MLLKELICQVMAWTMPNVSDITWDVHSLFPVSIEGMEEALHHDKYVVHFILSEIQLGCGAGILGPASLSMLQLWQSLRTASLRNCY